MADEMKDRELRMACLRMAQEHEAGISRDADWIVSRAREYYAFATGTKSDVVSDRELFDKIMKKEAEQQQHGLGAGVSGNEKLSGNEVSLNAAFDKACAESVPARSTDYVPDPAAVDDPWASAAPGEATLPADEWWKRKIGGGQ